MNKHRTAYIGLGSNLGNREDFIRKALKMLGETDNVEVVRTSDIIETAPLSAGNQPNYLNAVAEIRTSLTAEILHKIMLDIETSLGRIREGKWSPRTIDLDLLLFGGEVINTDKLIVPHPQMHLRSFVLKGLCQLNGDLVHPVIKESMNELASRLGGADFAINPARPQLISMAGTIGVGKTTLTKKLAELFGCKILLEPYDTNPFLPQVYAGRKDLALDSQLYFLTVRVSQLNPEALGKGQIIISDYLFKKELIYARRLLNPPQMALYEKIYPLLGAMVAEPVLVIYLRDSAQKCLERIHKRNRSYEQKIEPEFLEAIDSDYEQLLTDWKTCPVIRKQLSEFNCTGDSDIENLANQIRRYVAKAEKI